MDGEPPSRAKGGQVDKRYYLVLDSAAAGNGWFKVLGAGAAHSQLVNKPIRVTDLGQAHFFEKKKNLLACFLML